LGRIKTIKTPLPLKPYQVYPVGCGQRNKKHLKINLNLFIMKNFTVNTICDNQGFKQVFTCEGISKLWFGQWYDFNREIKQVSHVEVKEIQADGFNHALDLLRFESQKTSCRNDFKIVNSRLIAIETKILQKFGKKLKGKANKSKINSFLR